MFFHLALFFAVGFLAGPGGFYASPAEAPRPRTSHGLAVSPIEGIPSATIGTPSLDSAPSFALLTQR